MLARTCSSNCGVAHPDGPREVVGLNGPSARPIVRRLGKNLVTVALRWALYLEMEEDVEGSFHQGIPGGPPAPPQNTGQLVLFPAG